MAWVSHMLQQTGSNPPFSPVPIAEPAESSTGGQVFLGTSSPASPSPKFLLLSARWLLRVGQFFGVNTLVYYTMISGICVYLPDDRSIPHCHSKCVQTLSNVPQGTQLWLRSTRVSSDSGSASQTDPTCPFLQNQPGQQSSVSLKHSPGEKGVLSPVTHVSP